MSMQKTVYIPIEIKSRELYGHLILALACVRKGFRVYLGDKEGIFWLLNNKKSDSGIFFYKSGVEKYRKIVKTKCQHLAILDQELGISLNNVEENYKRRFPINKDFDLYFVVGEKHKNVIDSLWPEVSKKVKVTGWPKFDLYNKKFKFFTSASISNYILFASDFGYTSEGYVKEGIKRTLDANLDPEETSGIMESIKLTVQMFGRFVNDLKSLKFNEQSLKIIVRPHPSEDLSDWYSLAKDWSSKIQITREGDISDLIAGASLFVHRGSTTAVQAHMMGVPVVALDDYYDHTRKNLLSYKVSQVASDFNDVISNYDLYVKNNGNSNIFSDFSDEILYNQDFASERVACHLSGLQTSPEEGFNATFLNKSYYLIRQSLGNFIRRYFYDPSYYKYYKKNEKIGAGITSEEVVSFFGRIHAGGLKVRSVIKNVVSIE